MNILKGISIALLAVSSAYSYAAPINFVSGNDTGVFDTCELGGGATACTGTTAGSYVDPDAAGSVLAGASWLQAAGSYNAGGSNWLAWEADFGNLDYDVIITELFVAFDDDLTIFIGDTVKYISNTGLWNQWASATDVLGNNQWVVAAGEKLKFQVHNAHNGPTGIIWKGTATAVPEPGSLALLGLGLAGLGFSRRKSNKA